VPADEFRKRRLVAGDPEPIEQLAVGGVGRRPQPGEQASHTTRMAGRAAARAVKTGDV
jgi:hypothetical protein